MHLLFDLDGTLTHSSPGIVRCINHALASVGVLPHPEERLRPMIGAPLADIFGALLESSDAALVSRAVHAYRARFNSVGILENSLFPGIAEALDEFSRHGHTMQVVTVKPLTAARRVLDHFGIARFFAAVHAPELNERSCDKARLVAAALALASAPPGQAIVVGDRAVDVLAARRHQVRAVAAGWGYGARDELVEAGPEYVADTVEDLRAWVRSA